MGRKLDRLMARISALEEAFTQLLSENLRHGTVKKVKLGKKAKPRKATARKAPAKKPAAKRKDNVRPPSPAPEAPAS